MYVCEYVEMTSSFFSEAAEVEINTEITNRNRIIHETKDKKNDLCFHLENSDDCREICVKKKLQIYAVYRIYKTCCCVKNYRDILRARLANF